MNTSNFKDLQVWQKSITLNKLIYTLVKRLPREEIFALSDQMRRAAISVSSNIAEGHGRNSRKEFLNFLSYARGSLCELETQCIIAVEIGLLSEDDVAESCALCQEIGRMIKSLSKYLSDNQMPTTRN